MKAVLQIFIVLAVIYITQGNPLLGLDEANCTKRIEMLNNFADTCQQNINKDDMLKILNDIMHYNVSMPQINAYREQHCDTINEATNCLLENKILVQDPICENLSKYSKAVFSFDMILVKTLYLCGNNNGQHFDDLLPNNGLKCMYGSESYIKCFVNKGLVINADPNNTATEICATTQVHVGCLDDITDCPNDKAAGAMKSVVLLYKDKFNC